jgi:beta-lactam-binding protein with PASTA domain
MRLLGSLLAGLFASVLVAGCSESFSINLPEPVGATPSQGQGTLPVGGLNPITVPGQTAANSAGGVASQNPVMRALTLLNTLATSTVGGCAGPGSMVVPDLTNVTLIEAQGMLLVQGLKLGNVRWAYSETVPSGYVFGQDPAAGTKASAEAVVDLLASLGPQPVAVPDVAGKTQTEAQTAITGAGLTVGAITQSYSLTVPAGSVISQDPTAGTLALSGMAVSLVISQGPQPVAVPNVLGKTQAEAQAAIVAAGLSMGTVAQGSSPTVPVGIVMSQNPAADVMVIPGMAVDLVVSQGPEPVAVPDIVGRTQSDALAAVTGTGFLVGAVTEAWSAVVPAGSVVSQNPNAGMVMIPGTAVDFVVSKGPQPVAVPDVAGKTQAEAQAAIAGASLTVGTATEQYSDTVPEGSVVGQDPAAGTLLPPGTPVNLALATRHLTLCDYYPLAVGNKWVTAGTNGNNGISAEITETFTINGSQCWKVMSVDHAANDKTTYSYFASANGWMYGYESLDDLFLLPGIAPKAQKIAPQTVTPGESFTTNYNNSTLTVTPVKGRLSDFVSNVGACPFGDVEDAVALKLGNITLVVFARDMGPIYYNYITKSGFYSSITIVGGCGAS